MLSELNIPEVWPLPIRSTPKSYQKITTNYTKNTNVRFVLFVYFVIFVVEKI